MHKNMGYCVSCLITETIEVGKEIDVQKRLWLSEKFILKSLKFHISEYKYDYELIYN